MAQTKATKPKLDNQSGSSISKIAALYNRYLVDPAKAKDLTPKDFANMRAKDGTFMALTNLLTLPILASGWDIEPDEINDPDGVQAEFVKACLTMTPEQGGMSTPFHLVLADMLRSTYEGWRGFEKVYTLSPEGKIVFKKIVSYPTETLNIDMTDKGDFDGFTQTINGDPVKINKEKAVLITQGKERNWLKGESLLLAAATHYHEKQKFYYLGGLQAQAYAIPTRVAIAAENSTRDERADAAQDLQDAADLNSAVVLPFGYAIQDPSGSAKSDMIEFINHHDRQMALSILAQFLSLGSTSTGSFALSKDQTDLFNFVIKSIEKNLEYHINAFVIPDLTRFNFTKPSFPKLTFADLTDSMLEILENTFNTIVARRPEVITEEFAKGIVEKMALQLGIDVDELNVNENDDSDDIGGGDANGTGEMSKKKSGCDHNHEEFAQSGEKDGKWRRELTKAEQRVNFANIDGKMDSFEGDLLQHSTQVIEKMKAEGTAWIEQHLNDGNRRKALLYAVSADLRQEYHDIIVSGMLKTYNYGKTSASGEIKLPNIKTPKESERFLSDYATNVVELQCADIEFQLRQAIMAGNQVELALGRIPTSISDILALGKEMVGNWFNSAVEVGIGAMVSRALNKGREDTFDFYSEKVRRMQFSAILDKRVCDACAELDGTVVTYNSYRRSVWQPPIHFNCRCIWIAILDEDELPASTGFLSSYGGLNAPSLRT